MDIFISGISSAQLLHYQFSPLCNVSRIKLDFFFFLRMKRMHLLIYAVKYLCLGPLDMDLPCAQIIGRLSVLVYVNI